MGSKQDMSPWGNYDMAGNVKEWIWTEAESGKRYVLGGAWDEPNYMFIDPDAQSPFLRAANVGFRCVKYIEPDRSERSRWPPCLLLGAISAKRSPSPMNCSMPIAACTPTTKPLNATVEPFPSTDDDWKIERVTYDAAYGDERAIAYLFFRRRASRHIRRSLSFPGSNALLCESSIFTRPRHLDAILRSGRAVIYPVYKGTYERGDGMESDVANTSSTGATTSSCG